MSGSIGDWLNKSQTVKGELSLDRCTMLLLTPQLSLWGADEGASKSNVLRISETSRFVRKILDPVLDPDFFQGCPSELFMHHFRTSGGVDIQFGARMPKRKKVTDDLLLQAFGTEEDKENGYFYQYGPNNYAFRLEWNPNKSSLGEVAELLGAFREYQTAATVRIARLDIAIDFPATIVPSLVLCHGMRKSFSASGSNGIESLYFGTRQSKNYVRLYNKRQEIIDTEYRDIGHDLWRLELESKEAFFLNSPVDHRKVFERFCFYDGGVSSGDWLMDLIRQQAMAVGLQNVLRTMPKNTQTRYRKLFKALPLQDIEEPSFIYARDFSHAYARLRVEILQALGFDLVEATN